MLLKKSMVDNMKRKTQVHKSKKSGLLTITVTLPAKQYEFIEKHELNPDNLLQKAINIEKQKMLEQIRQTRKNKFNNEFKKIRPRIDKYIAEKRKKDALWTIRYKLAKRITKTNFMSRGGPVGDNLLERFISNYERLLRENKDIKHGKR
jgi:hypothetical protein